MLEQQDQRSNYNYYCYYLYKTSCSNSGSERETTALTSVFRFFLTEMTFNSDLLGAFFLDKSLISNTQHQMSFNSTWLGTMPLSYSPRYPLGNASDG